MVYRITGHRCTRHGYVPTDQAGMLFTIEPGIYIEEEQMECGSKIILGYP